MERTAKLLGISGRQNAGLYGDTIPLVKRLY